MYSWLLWFALAKRVAWVTRQPDPIAVLQDGFRF